MPVYNVCIRLCIVYVCVLCMSLCVCICVRAMLVYVSVCVCVCVYTDGPCSTYPSQDNMLSTSTYISDITDEIRHLIRFCDEVTRPSRESSTLLVNLNRCCVQCNLSIMDTLGPTKSVQIIKVS